MLTFIVAASPYHGYWASCGPAASHSIRSRLPCSFSRVEPISSVTVRAMASHYQANIADQTAVHLQMLPASGRASHGTMGFIRAQPCAPKGPTGEAHHPSQSAPPTEVEPKPRPEWWPQGAGFSGMYCLLFPAIGQRPSLVWENPQSRWLPECDHCWSAEP